MNATRMALSLAVALVIGAGIRAEDVGAAHAPPLTTSGGAVAADDATASAVGARILAAGGNAADAAVATALALGVINPVSSGMGGGGFAVVYDASTRTTRVTWCPARTSTEGAVRARGRRARASGSGAGTGRRPTRNRRSRSR